MPTAFDRIFCLKLTASISENRTYRLNQISSFDFFCFLFPSSWWICVVVTLRLRLLSKIASETFLWRQRLCFYEASECFENRRSLLQPNPFQVADSAEHRKSELSSTIRKEKEERKMRGEKPQRKTLEDSDKSNAYNTLSSTFLVFFFSSFKFCHVPRKIQIFVSSHYFFILLKMNVLNLLFFRQKLKKTY